MPQRWVPAVFMRGGTSKGLFFHAGDLPADPAPGTGCCWPPWAAPTRSAASWTDGRRHLLAVQGGRSPPDPAGGRRRLHLRPGGGGRPVVDLGANCGNLSSAVGPFASTRRCRRADGPALVRSTTPTPVGSSTPACRPRRPAETGGELAMVAWPGRGRRSASTSSTRRRPHRPPAPTGRPVDEVELADGGPVPAVAGRCGRRSPSGHRRAGLDGTEPPDELEARPEVMALLDRCGARPVLMGLAGEPRRWSWPAQGRRPGRPALPHPGRPAGGRGRPRRRGAHAVDGAGPRAVPVTGALCLGVACRAGTVAQAVAAAPPPPATLSASATRPGSSRSPPRAETAGGWRAVGRPASTARPGP